MREVMKRYEDRAAEVSPLTDTITKMQSLPVEKLEIVLDIIEHMSCSPMDVFESMRTDAQAKGIITEENVDDFVSNVRKEKDFSLGVNKQWKL